MKKNYNYMSDLGIKLEELPSFNDCETLEQKLQVAELKREYWKLCGHEMDSAYWNGVAKGIKAVMKFYEWTPVTEGFPEDEVNVLVTYIGCYDGKPHCDDTAYRLNGEWYWSLSNDNPKVEITAWKPSDNPYGGK